MTGCDDNVFENISNQNITRCTLTQNNEEYEYVLEATYEIYSTNDVVDKVITKEVMTSDDEDMIEEYGEYVEDLYEEQDDTYGGTTNKVKVNGNTLTSTTTIDYSEMDLDAYIEDYPSLEGYTNSNNQLLKNGLVRLYESYGATCK